jgi:hypothetical protein
MNRLFIELYLDEDVDVRIAELMKAYGFSASTARDTGQLGESDMAQLMYAVSFQKTLLTHNRADFEALAKEYAEIGNEHYGIILAVRRPAYEIVRRLLKIVNYLTADEIKNQVRYI